MELLVSQPNRHIIAHAITDNPYQARNFIAPHLTPHYTLVDPHTLQTAFGLIIRATPELLPLLQPTPKVINDVPFPLPNSAPASTEPSCTPTLITLRAICFDLKLQPIIARRTLRRHYGAQNIRYEWHLSEVPHIKGLLTCRL